MTDNFVSTSHIVPHSRLIVTLFIIPILQFIPVLQHRGVECVATTW